MARHPLDISCFLNPNESTSDTPSSPKPPKKMAKAQPRFTAPSPNNPSSQREGGVDPGQDPRIEKHYWEQLNPESRRIFTSRMWKSIDFNPMLSELTDLSKLTEKWLRWAIPTYANGVKEGPIKEWFEGKRDGSDFHYVLVGEHLKHLKEVRQKRKEDEQELTPEVTSPAPEEAVSTPHPNQDASPELSMALDELDGHIEWLQNYLEKNTLKS